MWEGIYPPIPTPFDDAGGLALDRLERNVDRWNDASADGRHLAGYVVMGSNGEAPHIALDEIGPLVAAVRRAALPAMAVIAGTGQLGTGLTIEATRRAADAGADAALVVTPFYYKGGMTGDALRRHFFAVADASPVPVLIYNVPANTGFNLPVALVPDLAAHDNIVGLKDSAGDVNQLAEMIRLARGLAFEVLSGNFGALLPSMTFGVRGAILAVANVAPGACLALYQAALAGSWAEAGELHLRLLPVARAVTSQFGVPGLKAALDALGYFGGSPRGPLVAASDEVRTSIRAMLREADLL